VISVHFLVQYFPRTVVNWIQIWQILRPQLSWEKFWNFFLQQLNGSTCAVSTSSYSGGGKHLHHFAANLSGKQCIEFRQFNPSFIGDIAKNIWSLFLDTVYVF